MNSATAIRLAMIVALSMLAFISLRRDPIPKAELVRRLPRCLAGLAMFGVGIAFYLQSNLGMPPWDVLHTGLAHITHQPTGLVLNEVGFLVLLLWIPLKEKVGLGTVLNTFEIGVVFDYTVKLIPHPTGLVARFAFVLIGIGLIALGSGLYIGSGLGAGPRDGVMMGLRKFGLSVRVARTAIELTTMGLGKLFGGEIGIGTAIFMIAIGPLVQPFLKKLALPPLKAPTVEVPTTPVSAL